MHTPLANPAKNVLITGGSHRLGKLLCTQFAEKKWHVWCHFHHSHNAAEELCRSLTQAGNKATPIQANLSEAAEREKMIHTIFATSGRLDCIVNNASSFEPDTGEAFDLQGCRQQLEVNLMAPVHLSSLMAQHLDKKDTLTNRSIVHVLDQKVFNLNPDYYSYTISKLALERTVALQAQSFAPHIRVCGVAPGLMFLSGPQSQENFDKASKINLLQRPIDPQQVAASCLFLAENPCINGITLTVDNGQHLVPLARDVMFVVDNLSNTP
jgi:NAD(P)-dependent dehydrogenase (short-subunit alcohol dehydrogenase family)